jgi:MoaA/NifB/PqqE/SkfB family radical SAM enzyme
MSAKFVLRTLRNVVSRNHPYFAHLAITHRCNLRCRFCHIRDSTFKELDTDGMKRVIDRLDDMGVGVVSISGGGEPLLRSDFAEIVDYAAGKGMYTKLTSNGTMPRSRYEQLLNSRVKEIGISLDGIRGNDLPYSHVGPRILDSIRYLHGHLPPQKQLTINVTVSETNRDQVEETVAFCAREFPRAKVWLNPVVAGKGALRTGEAVSAPPDYLRHCRSPNLLSANFYIEGVEKQFRAEHFDWGCRAGSMFFDIKPNGDFWLCQDQPSRNPLNILDPAFRKKLRAADFKYRKHCTGCTYSCYYVTQNGLSPRNWRDMAVLWWSSNTAHGDPCRRAASRYGWLAGLAMYLFLRLRAGVPATPSAALPVLLLMATIVLGGTPPERSPGEVLACMEQTNEQRQTHLPPFASERIYRAANTRFHREATVVAEVRQSLTGEKTFRIISHEGSRTIQRRVIERLLKAECRNSRPEVRAGTDIRRRNYNFEFLEEDGSGDSYIFTVSPKTPDKYLFRGKIWIDTETCGIRRLEGEPAVSPSFWVTKTAFSHDYGRFGEFWLPLHHRAEVQVRIFGHSTLDIEYRRYVWLSKPRPATNGPLGASRTAFCGPPQ